GSRRTAAALAYLSLAFGKDARLAGAVEEQNLVALLPRRVHAWRTGGHARHGETRRARAPLQQAIDEVGRHVALDHIALDEGGVTGLERLGNAMAPLDRRDVGDVLFLDRITTGA